MLETATFEAVQLPVVAVDVPYMREALRRWERARGDLLMPSERSAQPFSVESAVANSALIDVLTNPPDFRIRSLGPGLITAHGEDLAGRLVSTIEPSAYSALARGAYAEVMVGRAPTFHHLKVVYGRVDRSYFRLLLPLSENGREVTTLWSVAHFYRGPWQPPRG